jgi:plastocyanin
MRILIATLVAAVVLVSGCASSSGGSAAGTGNGKVQTIKVAVEGGKVVPSAHREKVPQGDTVRLVVTTDTADEVHVHGYDLKQDVAAGKTGTLEFVADQSGVFEVELEAAALQLVQLEVR